ncbi:MAG: type II toxin-antitoxin system RelE/ParE family toxin [Patescibacteria group bacterium]
MDYFLKPSALKDLQKLPKELQKRIIKKLDFYTSSPFHLEFAERLQGREFGEYRYRVGDYRIFFDSGKNRIIILRIKHRREAYR